MHSNVTKKAKFLFFFFKCQAYPNALFQASS